MKSKLPSSVLRRIWALSDIDQDGQLDRDEFAVALFLIDHKLQGNDLPDKLPDRLVPPSKRGGLQVLQNEQHVGGDGLACSYSSESRKLTNVILPNINFFFVMAVQSQ